MSSSILDLSISPSVVKSAPKVTGVRPLGSNILVELLNNQEMYGKNIIISEDVKIEGPPQAYVLEVGPGVTDPAIRALVGKRVLLNGRGTNLPVYDDSKRERILVEYPTIKAVLEEEVTACSAPKCCRA